jgi:hypothetical protein
MKSHFGKERKELIDSTKFSLSLFFRAAWLEQENLKLRLENAHLKQENVQLRCQIYGSTES